MKGVINSELEPKDLISIDGNITKLAEALSQPEYLIALMQRNFYNTFRYDLEHDDWGNITPNQYRNKIKQLLESLKDKMWVALSDVESEMRGFIVNSNNAVEVTVSVSKAESLSNSNIERQL